MVTTKMRPTRIEIMLVAALILVWIPGIRVMAEVWSHVEYASHGFLVPFVSLWAATAHRERLARLEPLPIRWGGFWIGVTLLAYLLALSLRDPTLIGLVAVLTAVVVVLAFRGVAWVRTLVFPLTYLCFMIPLPARWVTPLIVELQLLVSGVAVWILRAAGVAIFRDGNILVLPGDQSLFIAEACSGITSLITLIPIGVLIAYFTQARTLPRLLLVASVVPIALTGNLLRVLLTVELAIWGDLQLATEGPLHEWAGVGSYVIGCLCLLGIGAILNRVWPESTQVEPLPDPKTPDREACE
jgi:exosortase